MSQKCNVNANEDLVWFWREGKEDWGVKDQGSPFEIVPKMEKSRLRMQSDA